PTPLPQPPQAPHRRGGRGRPPGGRLHGGLDRHAAAEGGAAGPRGDLPTRTIGLHADLTGPGRTTGLAHRRGAQLAVDDHNSRTAQAFRLALRTEDDAGDAARALRTADRLVADPDVIAVLGRPVTCARGRRPAVRKGAVLSTVVVAAGAATGDGTRASCSV
ncbi:ABC transporter substrate-binding protein, partial [Streptomyces sp. MT29]|nr:ABC transporter substrate-binding protein [Streptomyces sp. MT29]